MSQTGSQRLAAFPPLVRGKDAECHPFKALRYIGADVSGSDKKRYEAIVARYPSLLIWPGSNKQVTVVCKVNRNFVQISRQELDVYKSSLNVAHIFSKCLTKDFDEIDSARLLL